MARVAASLAAALAAFALTACGDGGAEPGASDEVTLVLDFTPNAVHTGLYAALAEAVGVAPAKNDGDPAVARSMLK